MDLNIVWFILITVLFSGFFLLEGFDYGVGHLAPFITGDAKERRLPSKVMADLMPLSGTATKCG